MSYGVHMNTTVLTTTEVASRLGVTRQGVLKIVKRGQLNPRRSAGERGIYLFDEVEVDELHAEREEAKAS